MISIFHKLYRQLSHRPRALLALGAALASTALAGAGQTAHAQATPMIRPDARVYRDIDGLVASGLIDTVIAGARPYSRREIQRLLNEAKRNLDRNAAARPWAERTIAFDLAEYGAQGKKWIDAASAEVLMIDAPVRAAPIDSNGRVNALIDPIAANRVGQPFSPHGFTGTLETEHSLSLANWLAVAVSPRLTTMSETSTQDSKQDSKTALALQSVSANALFGNLSIEVGRDYALWGQSPTGGLLLSANAPTLDMLRISNDRPAKLPWIFGVIGPMRGTALIADLGANQLHPHAKLIGYHLSALPHPRLEFGVEITDIMGGGGVPSFSTSSAIVDVLPFIDPILRRRSDFVSNKFVGGNFRWRIPGVSGVEAYGEGALDDFDGRRFRSSVLEDGGYIFGVAASCLPECGRLGVRAEYRQTGIRYYTHNEYGESENGLILGDPLGPRGLGGYLTLDGDGGAAGQFALNGAVEVRSGNTYGSEVTGGDTRGFHFVLLSQRPGEKRTRVMVTWTPGRRNARMTVSASAGFERVTNFEFIEGHDRTNGLAQIKYEFRQ